MKITLTPSIFLTLLAAESVSDGFRKICEEIADSIDDTRTRLFAEKLKEAGRTANLDKIQAIKFIRLVAERTPGFRDWVMKEYPTPNGSINTSETGLGLAYAKGLVEYIVESLI